MATVSKLVTVLRKIFSLAEVLDILRTYLSWKNDDFYGHQKDQISFSNWLKILSITIRKASGEPLAYIMGYVPFYNVNINVNKFTLIPRPETEQMVDIFIKSKPSGSVLDLCCGSGAIACAIKYNLPDLEVSASDISPQALEVANENRKLHDLDIKFIEGDFLDPIEEPVDYIISNPPYIGRSEELSPSVIDFEPPLALFADNRGLQYYIELSKSKHMVKKQIFLELSKYLTEECESIFLREGWKNVQILPDWSGNRRFLLAES